MRGTAAVADQLPDSDCPDSGRVHERENAYPLCMGRDYHK